MHNSSSSKLYDVIEQDVMNLHFVHKTLTQLFGSEDRVETLNKAASNCASLIQNALTDSIILRLTKLLEHTGRGNQTNLVLESLLSLVDDDLEKQADLEARIAELRKQSVGLVAERNKRLAHRDLRTAVSPEVNRHTTTWGQLDEILRLIRDFMHLIEDHTRQSETYFEGLEAAGDGDCLMYYLSFGVRATALRERVVLDRMPDDVSMREFRGL